MTPRQWLGGAARVISTPLSIAAIMCAGKTDLSTRLPELLDCWQDPQIWECFRYTLFKYKIWNSSHTAFTARIFTSITHILYLSAPTWKLAATPPPPPRNCTHTPALWVSIICAQLLTGDSAGEMKCCPKVWTSMQSSSLWMMKAGSFFSGLVWLGSGLVWLTVTRQPRLNHQTKPVWEYADTIVNRHYRQSN